MITTHKDEVVDDASRMISKRSIRLTTYCSLLFGYCIFNFWYYSDKDDLAAYDKWQLTGLIFIALGSFFTILFQFIKHELVILEKLCGAALILGSFLYFIGICVQIDQACYCHYCTNEFACGCGVFGMGAIIFGTSFAIGLDVLYNYLSYHRTRMIVLCSILILASFFILINRFTFDLSGIQKVEEIGWILVAVSSILTIIVIGIIQISTRYIFKFVLALLFFIGGLLVLIGGIGGYTSSHWDSQNATVWVFYILVFLECIVLCIDVLTAESHEYEPLK